MSYSKTRIPGLLAPSTTPGSVVFHGVTPGLRNIVLMGDPVATDGVITSDYHSIMCQNVIGDIWTLNVSHSASQSSDNRENKTNNVHH